MMFLCAVSNGIYFVCGILFTYHISWIKEANPEISVAMGYSCFLFLDFGLVVGNQFVEPVVRVFGPLNLLRLYGLLTVMFNWFFVRYNTIDMLFVGYFFAGFCHQIMTFTLIYITTRNYESSLVDTIGYVFSGSAITFLLTALLTIFIINPNNLKMTRFSKVLGGHVEYYFEPEVTQGFVRYCYIYAGFSVVISFLSSFLIKVKPERRGSDRRSLFNFTEASGLGEEIGTRVTVSMYMSQTIQAFKDMNFVVANRIRRENRKFRSLYQKPNDNNSLFSGRKIEKKCYSMSGKVKYKKWRRKLKSIHDEQVNVKIVKDHLIKKKKVKKPVLPSIREEPIELQSKDQIDPNEIDNRSKLTLEIEETLLSPSRHPEKEKILKTILSKEFIIIYTISFLKTASNFFYSGEMKIYGMMLVDDDQFITYACLLGIVIAFFMRISIGRIFSRLGFKKTYFANICLEMASSCLYYFIGNNKTAFGIAVLCVRTSTGIHIVKKF